jgi:hypothetical protein
MRFLMATRISALHQSGPISVAGARNRNIFE